MKIIVLNYYKWTNSLNKFQEELDTLAADMNDVQELSAFEHPNGSIRITLVVGDTRTYKQQIEFMAFEKDVPTLIEKINQRLASKSDWTGAHFNVLSIAGSSRAFGTFIMRQPLSTQVLPAKAVPDEAPNPKTETQEEVGKQHAAKATKPNRRAKPSKQRADNPADEQ